jgi:hypothetical protein
MYSVIYTYIFFKVLHIKRNSICNSTIKKNEIMSFAGKWTEIIWPNTTYSHSFVNPRPEMMMMTVTTIIGHVWGISG